MKTVYSNIQKSSFILLFVILSPLLALSQVPGQPDKTENNCEFPEPGIVYATKALTTDTSFCEQWPYLGDDWLPQSMSIHTYNENGMLIKSHVKPYNQQSMQYREGSIYEYDYYEDGLLKTERYMIWNPDMNGGSWDDRYEYSYEYDEDGKKIFSESKFSNWGETGWYFGQKQFYSYNADGTEDTVLAKYFNDEQGEWIYYYRYRHYYDEEGNLIEKYRDWANNIEGDFSLSNRVLYIRNDENDTLQEINQYYNEEWVNDDRLLKRLNEDGLPVDILWQNWQLNENDWDTLVMMRDLFDYNEDGLEIFHKRQSYYLSWIDTDRTYTYYYEDGSMKEQLTQQWRSFEEEWQNSERCTYPPPQQTITTVGEESLTALSVYPNPADGYIHLEGITGFVECEVYNMAGQKLQNKNLSSNADVINLQELERGFYMLKLKDSAGKTHSKKIILK